MYSLLQSKPAGCVRYQVLSFSLGRFPYHKHIRVHHGPSLSFCVLFVMRGVFLLYRPGARDSENSSLTLGDLASLFTPDEEHDDEQCMPGSFGFQEQSEPSPE